MSDGLLITLLVLAGVLLFLRYLVRRGGRVLADPTRRQAAGRGRSRRDPAGGFIAGAAAGAVVASLLADGDGPDAADCGDSGQDDGGSCGDGAGDGGGGDGGGD
ncbi:hypothetical protein [Zavarzinia compransoris]|uniref:Uncharacterized protein n=1 Tax=Zavarzinia compransoris TaxID=1264899 RepID=A0A317E1A7_9PROT|nr:hypothetical protein [Zavarzinia compransoris]PWR20848.1 hypothetical protein DKG75_12720 [Zavarzinia compransoris]TDP44316.1 hypothetical protein DES42_10781 [Zavarzinia compransoris]